MWQALAGVPLTQRHVDAGGVCTRVVEAGEGEPLVLLHGIASHLEAHLTVLPALAERHRVVLYDMPGRGWSDKPDRPYTIDYLGDHLVALLGALDIPRAHLCGQSLGGWVAAWTAAHAPGAVGALVLNNPGNIASRPEALAKVRESNRAMVRDPGLADVRTRLEWLFGAKDAVTDEHVAIRHRMYRQPGFARAMEHIGAILDPEVRARYIWEPGWCGRIAAPTLVLWSAHNPLATLADTERLAAWIPGARVEVFDHSGEFPQVEEEQRFLDVVGGFLAGAASAPARS
jgi:2-hydroxy-6-oxonona-2,4-dienedioate hydrolase